MKDLKAITKLVKHILETDERTRNSDSFLYLRVLTTIGDQKGVDINTMSIPTFLLSLRECGFPPFESVRRARQKAQAANPELAACETVQGFRAANEVEYRAFSRS